MHAMKTFTEMCYISFMLREQQTQAKEKNDIALPARTVLLVKCPSQAFKT